MNVSEIITDELIKQIESGSIPWDKPFNGVSPRNYKGTAYRGINLLILGSQEFKSPFWFTFNRVRTLGGKVVKGSQGMKIVFWKWIDRNPEFDPDMVPDPQETDSKTQDKQYPILRYYTVFNQDQTEGIDPEKLPEVPGIGNPELTPIENIDRFISAIPDIDIRYSSQDKACYNPTDDYIQIPESRYFKSPEGYYSTHFHEIGHWTGHQDRLNRDLKGLRVSRHDYSFEELIAELSSAFLCGQFGILKETQRNHAGYIQSWVKVLKSDPKMIIKASSRAQKIVDYLGELTQGETQKTPETVSNAA